MTTMSLSLASTQPDITPVGDHGEASSLGECCIKMLQQWRAFLTVIAASWHKQSLVRAYTLDNKLVGFGKRYEY
jgi:hypothetical protein